VLTNLFYSFALPIDSSSSEQYTGATSVNGGYLDTALSGMASEKILVIGIDSSQYGELIDGKSIYLQLSTLLSTYDIYGTYENNNAPSPDLDSRVNDQSIHLQKFGPNRCLLFSDLIQPPNNDGSKSWSTGYSLTKPFSLNGKQSWNFKSNTGLGLVADKPVGIAYLDKGFIVITEPTIVDNFDVNDSSATGTTIEFNSVVSSVNQQIT
jgi:hypothetical protein